MYSARLNDFFSNDSRFNKLLKEVDNLIDKEVGLKSKSLYYPISGLCNLPDKRDDKYSNMIDNLKKILIRKGYYVDIIDEDMYIFWDYNSRIVSKQIRIEQYPIWIDKLISKINRIVCVSEQEVCFISDKKEPNLCYGRNTKHCESCPRYVKYDMKCGGY